MARLLRLIVSLLFLTGGVLAAAALPAGAHEERPAEFPDGSGHVPRFLGWDNPHARVVCKRDSGKRIARMPDGRMKRVSLRLARSCDFHSIETAVRHVRHRNTSIYVLPGTYRERTWATKERSDYCSHLQTESDDPLPASEYIGSLTSPDTGVSEHTHSDHLDAADGDAAAAEEESNPIALSYADQRRCFHNLNLISVFGDRTPDNDSIACDSKYCGTQIVGTGARQTDVVIDNRFSKLNGIRMDRAGGGLVKNLTIQQSEFNALYFMETDGFKIDHVTTRGNDEYGILAFASDHGVIQHTDNYYNGDSGIYPGSGSDLNGDSTDFKVSRYAIEIRYNDSHDNTLGYSGTAGNSIWAHHNDFHDNATGISTDSLFPGHPGLPQDHARWSRNRIHSNNSNYYTEFVDTGICDKPMAKRGYLHGTVCPVVPVPVGTGVLIAGGNYNSTDHNWIYDNWRYGTMQFWVPAPLRDDYDPTHLYDTSNHNHTVANEMGFTPSGKVALNGTDHWWDDEGEGNCWDDNHYARGEQSDNFTLPPPSCADGGSVFTPGLPTKDEPFLSCAEYDRSDPAFRHPPNCNWFDSPTKPEAGAAAPTAYDGPATEAAPQLMAAPALAVGGAVLYLGLRRGRRGRRP